LVDIAATTFLINMPQRRVENNLDGLENNNNNEETTYFRCIAVHSIARLCFGVGRNSG
jgi:hypothetical protein